MSTRLPGGEALGGIPSDPTRDGAPHQRDGIALLPLGGELTDPKQQRHGGGQPTMHHGLKIGLLALAVLTACGGRTRYDQTAPDRGSLLRQGPPLPLADVLILEQAGVSPSDTTVRFAARDGRTIVMRHVPPDNAVFATVTVPPDSGATDQVTMTLSQVPGRYGLRLSAQPRWPAGVTLTYSFAMHFQAPDGIDEHYLGPSLYEAALGIGRVLPDDRFEFLPTRRPAGDMLRATLSEPGQYAAAAPR